VIKQYKRNSNVSLQYKMKSEIFEK